ncbi:hypothetical protein [Citricoccus sp. NR2]|uniref:hypothetical protein n=1 Tax=Citricoccus sp. NR2 TaxID=3004095 RepID=UPI0022DD19E2|nr:hypothetical protein [Citricoccus sp. NR2]WBL18491.1 hypothetical protein O1A05_12085 [Citricoccus sp. NR2]
MSVLPWVRLDSRLPSNPKVLELLSRTGGHKAAFAYICGLSYCGDKGTFGDIPSAALPFLHATKREANLLVKVGLWTATETGYKVHDWDDYQPSRQYVDRVKKQRSEAARARWDKQKKDPT